MALTLRDVSRWFCCCHNEDVFDCSYCMDVLVLSLRGIFLITCHLVKEKRVNPHQNLGEVGTVKRVKAIQCFFFG